MILFKTKGTLCEEKQDGTPKDKNFEILTETVNWSDSEVVGTKWLEENSFSPIFKIKDISMIDGLRLDFNDNVVVEEEKLNDLIEYTPKEGYAWWQVTVAFEEEVDNGKKKITKEKYLVCEKSNVLACNRVATILKDSTMDWEVTDTKKLLVSSVLVQKLTHTSLKSRNELYS